MDGFRALLTQNLEKLEYKKCVVVLDRLLR